jgi:hypothetical protein
MSYEDNDIIFRRFFSKEDTNNYKRWAILQRLNELKKALKRNWTQERQDEFDNLRKDFES